MIKRIVVMGGCFNPPTIAHLRLLQAGVAAIHAEKGLFVPAPFPFVQAKMARLGHPEEAIPMELRVELLQLMTAEYPGLDVDDQETPYSHQRYSYDTMVQLQDKYPDAQLYFLAGGDILDRLAQWYRIEDFLERFHILAVSRNEYDPSTLPSRCRFLANYPGKFHVMPTPEGVQEISSTLVRQCLRDPEGSAEQLLHPAVKQRLSELRSFP